MTITEQCRASLAHDATNGSNYTGGVLIHLGEARLTYVEVTPDAAFSAVEPGLATVTLGICDESADPGVHGSVKSPERILSARNASDSARDVNSQGAGFKTGDTVGVLYDREAHTVSHFLNGVLQRDSGGQASIDIVPRGDRVRIALRCQCHHGNSGFAVQIVRRPPPADCSRA